MNFRNLKFIFFIIRSANEMWCSTLVLFALLCRSMSATAPFVSSALAAAALAMATSLRRIMIRSWSR